MIGASSYIKRSGQSWKIWLFLILLFVAAALFLIGFTTTNAQPDGFFVPIVLAGTCLVWISLIWLSISVRCKNRKAHLGWKAIAGQTHYGWLFWLLQSEVCPVCKDNGTSINDVA